MEKLWKVEFQYVGQSYFSQSRVECHYSLSAKHSWASNDWIGLFKVGWSSLKDYYTFVWALSPFCYTEETIGNCCVNFQASYLPRPSAEAYQFVYVDGKGEVCACSSPFTFCSPRPLGDLVTLEEEQCGEETGEDMLLVVPRADILQSRLEKCLIERAELLQAREEAERGKMREEEKRETARKEWERVQERLEKDITDLREKLRWSRQKMEKMAMEQQEAHSIQGALTAEIDCLLAERTENQQRMGKLEKEVAALTLKGLEKENELDRMTEKLKQMSSKRQDEEEERKRLQSKLDQSEGELRSLSSEFQGLRCSLAQRDTQALQLRHSLTTLTYRLNTAQGKEAEREAVLSELCDLKGRLSASEGTEEGLRRELGDLKAQQDRSQFELHQSRLQAAQLTLQLADASLALREGRASWTREREGLFHSAEDLLTDSLAQVEKERVQKLRLEVEVKEEWLQNERMEREKVEVELGKVKDCNRVQLSENRRDLNELKTNLRLALKEKEQQQREKQDLMEYTKQLEQKLEAVAGAKWTNATFNFDSRPESPLSVCEDENPEALRLPQPYSLCNHPQDEMLLLSAPSASQELSQEVVVISQPAPFSTPGPARADEPGSELEGEEQKMAQSESLSSGAENTGTILRELANSHQW